MKYEKIQFNVKGLSPLLCHNPESMGKNPRNEGGRIEAELMVYKNNEGQFVLPTVQFLNALLYASKGRRLKAVGGKARAASGVITSSVFVPQGNEYVVLIDLKTGKPFKDFEIDTRYVVVNRGRIPRSRPMFSDWGCTLFLSYDTDRLAPEATDEIHSEAGLISGAGDFRPSTKGWFGRYEITRIKESPGKKAK